MCLSQAEWPLRTSLSVYDSRWISISFSEDVVRQRSYPQNWTEIFLYVAGSRQPVPTDDVRDLPLSLTSATGRFHTVSLCTSL